MIRNIVKDIEFLKIKSTDCTKDDLFIADDLRDTLMAHKGSCVGMAANMIGYSKRIIIISLNFYDLVMINLVIVEKHSKYKTEEGCLSLVGVRPCTRFDEITVEYFDSSFVKHKNTYRGYTAQIIQHECDHLNGVII